MGNSLYKGLSLRTKIGHRKYTMRIGFRLCLRLIKANGHDIETTYFVWNRTHRLGRNGGGDLQSGDARKLRLHCIGLRFSGRV